MLMPTTIANSNQIMDLNYSLHMPVKEHGLFSGYRLWRELPRSQPTTAIRQLRLFGRNIQILLKTHFLTDLEKFKALEAIFILRTLLGLCRT